MQEHMLYFMDKSTREEHLSQPLQTNNKQFKIAVTFLTGYNGIFNITNENKKFYSKKALIDDVFIQITIPPGGYEIESLDFEIRLVYIDKEHYKQIIHSKSNQNLVR